MTKAATNLKRLAAVAFVMVAGAAPARAELSLFYSVSALGPEGPLTIQMVDVVVRNDGADTVRRIVVKPANRPANTVEPLSIDVPDIAPGQSAVLTTMVVKTPELAEPLSWRVTYVDAAGNYDVTLPGIKK